MCLADSVECVQGSIPSHLFCKREPKCHILPKTRCEQMEGIIVARQSWVRFPFESVLKMLK